MSAAFDTSPLSFAALRDAQFVGRERELSALAVQMREAIEGRGSAAFIEGEPGIGKTRLARELAAEAETLGVRVLCGSCDVASTGIPYDPIRRASANAGASNTDVSDAARD